MGHVAATFDQRAYRFRNDDGDEADATWKDVQGTPVNQNIGEVFRLRIAVQETAGGGANNQTIVLQSNVNNEGWFDVDSTSPRVRLGNSQHVSDGAATTRQLTGTTGTFLPGVLLTETSGTNISFSGNDHTEVEWASLLITGEVAHGQTVQFRVTINGSLPATTTSGVPTVTAQAVAPTESPTLSAGTPTSDTIPLSWTAVAGAETYELQRDLTTIQNTSALIRDDSGLDVETEYSYRVRAVNDVGEGPWSNTVTESTTEPPPPPVLALANTFEGGVHDTAFTLAGQDPASGDPFDTFARSAGNLINYDNTRLRPSSQMSLKLHSTGGPNAYVAWTTSINAGITRFFGRCYLNVDDEHIGTRLLLLRDQAAADMGGWGTQNDRRYVLRGPGGTALQVSGNRIPENVWVRFEWVYDFAAGYAEIRYFKDPEAHVPFEVMTADGISYPSGATLSRSDFGPRVQGFLMWIDDIALTEINWPEPTDPVPTTPTAVADADHDSAPHDTLVTLDGTGSSGSDLSYQWEQVRGPTRTITDPDSVVATFTVDDDRDYREVSR